MCDTRPHHSHHEAPHSRRPTDAHPRSQPHSHIHDTGRDHPSRRDFMRVLMGGALAGASVLELAYHRAAWARSASQSNDEVLFDLQKAGDGVYFAHARAQTVINCNAAIFVRSKDVVVVDAHSKPSAAESIVRQIRREITVKPVRYVINTHFHWDHTQGDHGYRLAGQNVDFIASDATKGLMEKYCVERMKASADAVPQQIENLRHRAEKSSSAAERSSARERFATFRPILPTSRTIVSSCPPSPLTSPTCCAIRHSICILIFTATPTLRGTPSSTARSGVRLHRETPAMDGYPRSQTHIPACGREPSTKCRASTSNPLWAGMAPCRPTAP